ncbi:cobalt-precorrin-6A reductase [Sulfitobacter sp. S190]|uniref:cobalt-precorrin-6A reductase n=1 Tax=Sulfitobacter sp. S190 TaxID=2867022 RepID=UPI0021A88A24|nr:cobalt-precorrin-6A reductase [Sulfitobacter sp. S190]UWR22331.1 cobalt-precorrin-6A reductase [Sulfitobacter sp. S190]
MRVLLLGGTTEASQLARLLKTADIETVFSYAGRTNTPIEQPVPVRVGGFGGEEGFDRYLAQAGITHVIDATHPFAATMAHTVHTVCTARTLPVLRLARAPWQPQAGDDWQSVPDIAAAIGALPDAPASVFLAIGRMHVDQFAAKPAHRYLLRLVDAPQHPPALPQHQIVVARGPFDVAGDRALMKAHGVTHLVAKNAGGTGAVAKITAARALAVRVIMIDRPYRPPVETVTSPEGVLVWLGHSADRGV